MTVLSAYGRGRLPSRDRTVHRAPGLTEPHKGARAPENLRQAHGAGHAS